MCGDAFGGWPPCFKRLASLPADEPTSGLDARAAGIVMDAVRATVVRRQQLCAGCLRRWRSLRRHMSPVLSCCPAVGRGLCVLCRTPDAPLYAPSTSRPWTCLRWGPAGDGRMTEERLKLKQAQPRCSACPPIHLAQAFDELLLLKPGGSTIYFGPLGDESGDLLAFFQALPGVAPCPPNYNPANW